MIGCNVKWLPGILPVNSVSYLQAATVWRMITRIEKNKKLVLVTLYTAFQTIWFSNKWKSWCHIVHYCKAVIFFSLGGGGREGCECGKPSSQGSGIMKLCEFAIAIVFNVVVSDVVTYSSISTTTYKWGRLAAPHRKKKQLHKFDLGPVVQSVDILCIYRTNRYLTPVVQTGR